MFLRPFCSATDFSPCQRLIPTEWTFPGCTDEERDAHRTYVLTNMLKDSTYTVVAEDTDSHELLGVLFARFADLQPSAQHTAQCQARLAKMALVLEHGSDDARRALAMERSVARVHEVLDLKAADTLSEHNELTLFCVAESARGRGIGSQLRREFEQHLLARGGRSYYLMTDAVCNVGYYESHDFTRIATFSPAIDGGTYPNEAYYYQKTLRPEGGATTAGPCDDRERACAEHGVARESSASEGDRPQPRPVDGEAETPAQERPRVRYRPFDVGRDLESAIEVVPASWRPEDLAYDDDFVRQMHYGLFAHLVRDASFLEVAIVDEPVEPAGDEPSASTGREASNTASAPLTRERVVGVLAGRFGPAPDRTVPNPVADALDAHAKRAMEEHPKGAKWAQYRSACNAANVAMIAQARYRDLIAEDNELILFINDPSVRGQGVGATMLLRFEDYLRAQGARDYYLFTDTTCTYGYYERHGFTRVALCNDLEADDDIAIFLGAKSYEKCRSEHAKPGEKRPFEEFVYMRAVPSLAHEA